MKLLTKLAMVALPFLLIGCDMPPEPPKSAQEIQAEKGKQLAEAALSNNASNAELENISKRIKLTSQPGLIGYVVLMNESGQPVIYTSVLGKITSSGKRLTPPQKKWSFGQAGGGSSQDLGPTPSDEGAWGSSDNYIYFWTVDGQYMQWNGKYLYSDSPIRLSTEPLVVSVGQPTGTVSK